MRVLVAENKNTPTDVWLVLSTDTALSVRMAVATNMYIAPEILERLSTMDTDVSVRWNAKSTPGKGPSTESIEKGIRNELRVSEPDFTSQDARQPVRSTQIDELERLARLYQDDLLTDDEYAAMKAKLIADS